MEVDDVNSSTANDHFEYRGDIKFETIFNESSLGNKIINSDLRILKINKALLAILGYSEKELLGVSIVNFSHPDFKTQWLRLRDELWTHKRSSFSIDTCIVRKDKSSLWCHVTSIVFEDEGNTLGYTILEDISERKRLERVEMDFRENELLIRQQREIVKATVIAQEKERERISEALHNSIGQLLFATKIQLNQLKRLAETDEDRVEAFKKTEELLSMSIKESRQMSHQLMPAVLNDFGLKTAMEGMCREMTGDVEFTCGINLLSTKKEKYLEMVIYRMVQELILNTAKHSKASWGRVTIDEDEKGLTITFEDNGIGFDTKNSDQNGLGLLTIRNNVTLLKGSIQLHSIPQKKTAIKIWLPKS